MLNTNLIYLLHKNVSNTIRAINGPFCHKILSGSFIDYKYPRDRFHSKEV